MPASITAVVHAFESEGRKVVRTADIAEQLGRPQSNAQVRQVVRGMREHGWLADLPLLGAYEFLPVATLGFQSGDAFIELRASLEADPSLRAQVGLGSAAFSRDLSDRRPDREVVFVDNAHRVPNLERIYDVIRVMPDRLFGAEDLNGIPTSTVERLIIEAAVWWSHAGDLRDSEHWLGRAVKRADPGVLREMARRVGGSTERRVAYLAIRFDRPDLANFLGSRAARASVTYLGPRSSKQRSFQADLRLYDGIGVASR